MICIDLFAGIGGFSEGARLSGNTVAWAANHDRDAVHWHAVNHPDTDHVCQDLHQANWEEVPTHDVMLASPCCQGHSRARGQGGPNHDASRSTAWAVVSAAEYHQPEIIIVENVPEFLDWKLFGPWKLCLKSMGYRVCVNHIDAADHGVPQNRVRIFLVCTKSRAPMKLKLDKTSPIPIKDTIDFDFPKWTPIDKPGRSVNTLKRVANGRKEIGDVFVMPYYGASRTGRSIDRPIGTITTRDRWAIVKGDKMRMLNKHELRKAMGFPDKTVIPDRHRLAVHLLGNAVCPPVANDILNAIHAAA